MKDSLLIDDAVQEKWRLLRNPVLSAGVRRTELPARYSRGSRRGDAVLLSARRQRAGAQLSRLR